MMADPEPRERVAPANPGGSLLIRIERIILLTVVAILPLVYTPDVLADPFNTPKLAVLFMAVCAAGGLRIGSLILGSGTAGLRALRWPAGLMGTAFVVSWLFTDYHGWSLLGLWIRYAGLLPYLAAIAFAVLLADAFAGTARPIVVAIVLGGAGVGAVSLYQMLFAGRALGSTGPTALVTSTIGNPNFVGGYLGIALPLCLALWLTEDRWARVGMVAAVFVGSGLVFSLSQGGWFAALAGLAIVAGRALSGRKAWATRAGAAVAAGAAALAVSSVVATMFVSHPYARLPGFLTTAIHRGFTWEEAASLGAQRPLTGWGPNSFAIQGPLHREVEEALLLGFEKTDDPHSVPMAMWANLGLLGLIGFGSVALWGWRRTAATDPRDFIAAGLQGGLVAYLVQSLVSIDEVPLRVTLWSLIGAIGCLHGRRAEVADVRSAEGLRPDGALRRAGGLRRAAAAVPIAAGLAGAAVACLTVAVADAKVDRGVEQVRAGRFQEGRGQIEGALDLRPDFEYRRVLAGVLGGQAFEGGDQGGPLIDDMKEVFGYLDDFPDAQALTFYGELLNQYSLFDPTSNEEALLIYERVQVLDPHNPLLALDKADAHLGLNDPAAAEADLAHFERLLTEVYPEYSDLYSEFWGALAIARVKQGRIEEADATLDRAAVVQGCRTSIALELIAVAQGSEPPLTLAGLICPSTLRLLLTDEEEGPQSAT